MAKGNAALKLNSRTVASQAGAGEFVHLNSFYIHKSGADKVRYRSVQVRSDTCDRCERSFSTDNGLNWGPWEPVAVSQETPAGVMRMYACPGFVDPEMGLLLTMVIKGLLPHDNPLEGMKQYYLAYQVSDDGGRTSIVDQQVIQEGDYTPEHPLEGVWVGRNSMMIGDQTCRPLRTRAGKVLAPVQVTPIGPDGEYYNPGGGYTYHEAAVLIGTWRPDKSLQWELSQRVANDPARSTRGCIEPTLAELPDGRILMVIRGSNGGVKDPDGKIPAYRWYSISADGGYTWSAVQPWTYHNGEPFFSPSSCSQLLHHSKGGYYWLGNITPQNPCGNLPRYPFVIGEVDAQSGLLRKDTVITLDDRQPGDSPGLQLSCFMAHEDRETTEILLHMSRFGATVANQQERFFGDAYLYRIGVDAPTSGRV